MAPLVFLEKAQQELNDAELLCHHASYNSAANRMYYACFHAAIVILAYHGFTKQTNPHEWVRNTLFAVAVNSKKFMPREIAQTIQAAYMLRDVADYHERHMSKNAVLSLLKQTKLFVEFVTAKVQP